MYCSFDTFEDWLKFWEEKPSEKYTPLLNKAQVEAIKESNGGVLPDGFSDRNDNNLTV